jgi:hypothetical protein
MQTPSVGLEAGSEIGRNVQSTFSTRSSLRAGSLDR